jgi:hypothetical protein
VHCLIDGASAEHLAERVDGPVVIHDPAVRILLPNLLELAPAHLVRLDPSAHRTAPGRRPYSRLLASPELTARTITAVRQEDSAQDVVLEETEVIEALSALEPVWDELYPAEQARILRLLIERIDVAPDGISVTLHAAGIRSLVAELASENPDSDSHAALMEAAE